MQPKHTGMNELTAPRSISTQPPITGLFFLQVRKLFRNPYQGSTLGGRDMGEENVARLVIRLSTPPISSQPAASSHCSLRNGPNAFARDSWALQRLGVPGKPLGAQSGVLPNFTASTHLGSASQCCLLTNTSKQEGRSGDHLGNDHSATEHFRLRSFYHKIA